MTDIPPTLRARQAFGLLYAEYEDAIYDGLDAQVSTPADVEQTAPMRDVLARTLLNSSNAEVLPLVVSVLMHSEDKEAWACLHALLRHFAASQTERLSAAGAFDD